MLLGAVIGLTTYRWSNNLRSVVLLAAFPFLLLALLGLIAYVAGWLSLGPDGRVDPLLFETVGAAADGARRPSDLALAWIRILWLPCLVVAAIWTAIGYLFHDAMIRFATGARPVARSERPELWNLLENLCISRGLAMPALHIVDSPALNAFASGLGPRTFAITVTSGLVEALDRDELEAVLAHELTHIINRDVRLLIVTVVFAGMISFLSEMAWRSVRFGGSRDRKGNAIMIAAAVVLMVGSLTALLLRLSLSRTREFMADAGAVALTKNPDALIGALQKIAGHADMPEVPAQVRQMFFENRPGGLDMLASLFQTHPSIESRIEMLVRVGGRRREHRESVIPESGQA